MNTKKKGLLNMLESMMGRLFEGEQESSPEGNGKTGAADSRANIVVEMESGQDTSVPELMLRSLQESFSQFLWKNRLPHHKFRILRFETYVDEENRELLTPFLNIEPASRHSLARMYLASANCSNLVDFSGFQGWEIIDLTDNDNMSGHVDRLDESSLVLRSKPIGKWVMPAAGQEATHEPLLTLSIRTRAGTECREIRSHSEFPLTIGRGSHNSIQIENRWVSRQCVAIARDSRSGRFSIENVGQSSKVSVDDHSLQKDQRQPLSHWGSIVLAADSEEPVVIDYQERHSYHDSEQTFRMDEGRSQAKRPAASRPAADATVGSTPAPAFNSDAEVRRSGVSPPTIVRRRRLARLEIEYPDGRREEVDVHKFPLEIGRDPDTGNCQAVVIQDSTSAVSRNHLRIERSGSTGFIVENRAATKSGTWVDGKEMPYQFSLDFAEGKWLELGTGAKIRLLKAEAETA